MWNQPLKTILGNILNHNFIIFVDWFRLFQPKYNEKFIDVTKKINIDSRYKDHVSFTELMKEII